MKSIGYAIATIVGLFASFVLAVMLMFGAGGWRSVYGIVGLFALLHFLAYLLADIWNERGKVALATLALISPPVVVTCGWWIINSL